MARARRVVVESDEPLLVEADGEQRDEATIYLQLARACGVNVFGSSVLQRTLERDGWSVGVAENGKGAYFSATDANGGAEIEAALNAIFKQIQAVNSVFASVALPLSVNSELHTSLAWLSR